MVSIYGIQLDFISNAKFEKMNSIEKIRYIIDEVKKNKIIILESGLDPKEETKLIEMTMIEISDTFLGIEIESCYKKEDSRSIFGKFFSKKNNKLTIIGPANMIKTLKKEKDLVSTLLSNNK